jgi:low affinity Fe/Cu permease
MNTISSIVTFLMVFLIQNTQNRDSAALQLKLDELIRATEAKNKLIGIERLSEPELESVREKVEKKETSDRLYDSNSARDSEDQEFKAKR